MSPFLTIAEAAELARVSPKRVRTLMREGTLVAGVHFSRPRGLRPRIFRAPFLAWLAGDKLDESSSRPPVSRRGRNRVNLDIVRGE